MKIMRLFNKYFWDSVQWKYWYVPKYKLQLFRRMKDISYCNFDIVDSLIEIVFTIYLHWWESCKDQYKELDKVNKQFENWFTYEEANYIYNYITLYRKTNENILDLLWRTYHNSRKTYSERIEGGEYAGLYEWKSDEKYRIAFKIKNNFEKRLCEYINVFRNSDDENLEDSIKVLIEYENLINKWDDEILHLIINKRGSMWV